VFELRTFVNIVYLLTKVVFNFFFLENVLIIGIAVVNVNLVHVHSGVGEGGADEAIGPSDIIQGRQKYTYIIYFNYINTFM